jgi:hypothetical protein
MACVGCNTELKLKNPQDAPNIILSHVTFLLSAFLAAYSVYQESIGVFVASMIVVSFPLFICAEYFAEVVVIDATYS